MWLWLSAGPHAETDNVTENDLDTQHGAQEREHKNWKLGRLASAAPFKIKYKCKTLFNFWSLSLSLCPLILSSPSSLTSTVLRRKLTGVQPNFPCPRTQIEGHNKGHTYPFQYPKKFQGRRDKPFAIIMVASNQVTILPRLQERKDT